MHKLLSVVGVNKKILLELNIEEKDGAYDSNWHVLNVNLEQNTDISQKFNKSKETIETYDFVGLESWFSSLLNRKLPKVSTYALCEPYLEFRYVRDLGEELYFYLELATLLFKYLNAFILARFRTQIKFFYRLNAALKMRNVQVRSTVAHESF